MKKKQAPNFLFIMADQLAAKALSFYGNQTSKTPTLNKLAKEGVVFENCYCNLPMCGPSRASLHTGRMPFSIGMYDNASEYRSSIPSFAHYLRNLNYRAELSGKMHFVGADQLHGYEKRHTTEIYPANFGWTVDWSKGREYRPTNLTMASVIESGPCIRSMQMDYDEEVANAAKQAIYDLARKKDDKPFFLTVSFTQPHSPFTISQDYWDKYNHDDIELPTVSEIPLEQKDHLSRNLHYCQGRNEFSITDEHRRNARHGYYGMISYIDDQILSLKNVLEKTGLADNTIIVFTADHGEMMGERGMWYKQHFFEWASKVPLIIHAPNKFKPSRINKNISLIDLLPTFVDIATEGNHNNYLSKEIEGQSLYPALQGDSKNISDIVISEFAADGSTGPSRMVKKSNWKYMYLEGVDELLYNLEEDPNEIKNLIDDKKYLKIVEELRGIALHNWDPQRMKEIIRKDQERRLFIHKTTNGEPTWVNIVRVDDGKRYVRNGSAANTKARARFPFVSPAKPDIKK